MPKIAAAVAVIVLTSGLPGSANATPESYPGWLCHIVPIICADR